MLSSEALNKLKKYARELALYDDNIERIILIGDMEGYPLSHNTFDIAVRFNPLFNESDMPKRISRYHDDTKYLKKRLAIGYPIVLGYQDLEGNVYLHDGRLANTENSVATLYPEC
jgi:hypothetical protein